MLTNSSVIRQNKNISMTILLKNCNNEYFVKYYLINYFKSIHYIRKVRKVLKKINKNFKII